VCDTGQLAIPERASPQVKLTVTSALYQPLLFAARSVAALRVGAVLSMLTTAVLVALLAADGAVVRTVRLPFRFDSWEPRRDQPPPSVGQHSAEILRELGYEQAEIEELLTEGAVAVR